MLFTLFQNPGWHVFNHRECAVFLGPSYPPFISLVTNARFQRPQMVSQIELASLVFSEMSPGIFVGYIHGYVVKYFCKISRLFSLISEDLSSRWPTWRCEFPGPSLCTSAERPLLWLCPSRAGGMLRGADHIGAVQKLCGGDRDEGTTDLCSNQDSWNERFWRLASLGYGRWKVVDRDIKG